MNLRFYLYKCQQKDPKYDEKTPNILSIFFDFISRFLPKLLPNLRMGVSIQPSDHLGLIWLKFLECQVFFNPSKIFLNHMIVFNKKLKHYFDFARKLKISI